MDWLLVIGVFRCFEFAFGEHLLGLSPSQIGVDLCCLCLFVYCFTGLLVFKCLVGVCWVFLVLLLID